MPSLLSAGATGRINFGSGDEQYPPDFHFDREDFAPVVKDSAWDGRNPKALEEMLSGLMQQYRFHQHRQVLNHSSSLVRYEYTSTIKKPKQFGMYFIDVVTLPAVPFGVPVRFVVSFPDIHASMGTCPLKKLIAQSPPQIVVSYDPQADGGMVASSELLITAEVAALVGGIECLPWSGENVYLGIYVKAAEVAIREQLVAEAANYVARRRFIASCLSHFGSALLEYDLEQFRSIHFLFEVNTYYAVVAIALPRDNFPAEPPTITIQSLHQPVKSKSPLSKTFAAGEMPYSPRWSTDEMAIRTRTFLQEKLPILQAEELK